MNQSENIEKLALALSKAQGEIENATKDAFNPHFKSKYADLASVWNACREALTINELAVVQLPSGGPDVVTVTTKLIHSSGQFIETGLTIKPIPATAQGIGSAITYARRYSLMAMIGVSSDDDDGNQASEGRPEKVAQKAPSQFKTITQLAKQHSIGKDSLLKICGVTTFLGLSEQQGKEALDRLDFHIKEAMNHQKEG